MTDIVLTHLADIKVLEFPAPDNTATVVICPNCKKGPLDIEHLVRTICSFCENAFMGMGTFVAYTSGSPGKLRPFLRNVHKNIQEVG